MTFISLENLLLVLFHVDRVFFSTPKKAATSLCGVLFSNSFRDLYLILCFFCLSMASSRDV